MNLKLENRLINKAFLELLKTQTFEYRIDSMTLYGWSSNSQNEFLVRILIETSQKQGLLVNEKLYEIMVYDNENN